MKIINYNKLAKREKDWLSLARKAAERTLSKSGDRIGALIVDEEGRIFCGAAIARMRSVSSTCAERMALDNLLFAGNSKPRVVVIIGKISGKGASYFCTPCGQCRQTFQEICRVKGVADIDFIVSNWKKTRILKTTLSELFPMAFRGEYYQYL